MHSISLEWGFKCHEPCSWMCDTRQERHSAKVEEENGRKPDVAGLHRIVKSNRSQGSLAEKIGLY